MKKKYITPNVEAVTVAKEDVLSLSNDTSLATFDHGPVVGFGDFD